MARAALIAALAALVAGCGASDAPITGGGRVVGDAVTVYSSLPDPGRGAARDLVEGQKLALLRADGKAGALDVNFVSVDEGTAGADEPAEVAASAAEEVIRDPQVLAVIGALRSQTALTSIPLYNAAGILLLSPGAGYAGFTSPVAPGEPERWFPSPRPNFSRLIADDAAQAAAMLDAARGRVLVEAEAGRVPEALAAAVVAADAEGRIVDDPARADTVIYAGTDVESAAGVAESIEGADLVFGDELARAGLADRLPPAARRRATFVSSAPEPGSTPELRSFEAGFLARYGRRPGPYAVLGWRAMRRVLEAIEGAGERANRRQAVIRAYFELPAEPRRFTTFRARDL